MIESIAQTILNQAVELGTSDIHLLPSKVDYHVLFRMNGQLEFIQSLSIDEGKRLISYFKYLANMDTGEKRKPQSGASDFLLSDN